MKHCSHCNTNFPEYFEFCGSCGQALTAPAPVSDARPMTSHVNSTREGSEAKSAPALTILSSYSEPEASSQFHWPQGLIVGFLLVLFVTLLGIGGWYWWRRPVTQTSQSSIPTSAVTTGSPSTLASEQPTPAITPSEAPSANSAEEEIKQFQDRRIQAGPSERLELISALQQAEKKYPNDYRFPYELAKLSIKGSISHDDAFRPLARAAQKAIDNGQADEMLNSLMADEDVDFHKLSHGHHEWAAIERALRNRDKGLLKISAIL